MTSGQRGVLTGGIDCCRLVHRNSTDESIENWVVCTEERSPQDGDEVSVVWPADGREYKGTYLGSQHVPFYKVLFEDESVLTLGGDHVYELTDNIPKRVLSKIVSTACVEIGKARNTPSMTKAVKYTRRRRRRWYNKLSN